MEVRNKALTAKQKSDWRRLIELTSGLSSISTGNREMWLWRAQAKIKSGDFFGAREDLQKLLSEHNDDVYAMRLMYDLEAIRQNFKEAVAWGKRLTEARSNDADGHLRVSRALVASNDVRGAIASLNEARRSGALEKDIHTLDAQIKAASNWAKQFENRAEIHRTARACHDFFDFDTPGGNGCTIIVPAFNAEDFLALTIDSIIDSRHDDIEIIIVDDCSNDRTAEIAKRYETQHECVHYLRLKKNSGSSVARNHGIARASKPYVTFLDADDLMVRGGITRRIHAAKQARLENRFVIGSYGGSATIAASDKLPPESAGVTKMVIVDYLASGGNCPFNSNQPLFFTTFIKNSEGFPEDSRTAEDWPYWIKLLRRGGVIVPTHKLDVTYRMRPNSLVRQSAETHMHKALEILHQPYRRSDELFEKPLEEYRIQHEYAPRFFAFWGMRIAQAYATGSTPNQVSRDFSKVFEAEVEQNLPDLGLLPLNVRNIENQLLSGVARYYCVKDIRVAEEYSNLKQLIRGFALGAHDYGVSTKTDALRGCWTRKVKRYDIAFFPHKRYHARSAHLIAKRLERHGLSSIVIDFSSAFGDEGVGEYLSENPDLAWMSYTEYRLSLTEISAAAAFNDWDRVVKEYLAECKRAGIQTIGIVEGVNDYLSVDTKGWRPAYQFVEHLLLPGQFDKRYFPEHNSVHVCGVQRLDSLIEDAAAATSERELDCVINSNFTYGVLTGERLNWLRDICGAMERLDLRFVISRHPQDVGSIEELEKYVDRRSMYELLKCSKVFVTRFSGAVYEALLSGTHVVYYNPGIERWDMFADPQGAYEYVTNRDDLERALRSVVERDFETADSTEFLRLHCDIDGEATSSEKTAAAIARLVSEVSGRDNSRAPQRAAAVLSEIHELVMRGELQGAMRRCQSAMRNKFRFSSGTSKILYQRYRSLQKRMTEMEGDLISANAGSRRQCENVFLVMSCRKYLDRIDMLRPLYQAAISPEDQYFFVVGGAEEDRIEGDIMHLRCGDLYENLPSKVFNAVRTACQRFDFKRIVKIDDDIYLNINNFYKVLLRGAPSYYGRRNPPIFGTPLNDRWHYGKITQGHIYQDRPFPIYEPAQWNSGGFYLLDRSAAEVVAAFHNREHIENHVYEDYMMYCILADSGIFPSFHENSVNSHMPWMLPTMKDVVLDDFSALCPDFDASLVVSIHCGPTTLHKVDQSRLVQVFKLLEASLECRAPASL